VRVLADDPAARLDIPAWCRMTGQDFLGTEPLGGAPDSALAFLVKRLR
jgi:TusA-related sulfurtransferase